MVERLRGVRPRRLFSSGFRGDAAGVGRGKPGELRSPASQAERGYQNGSREHEGLYRSVLQMCARVRTLLRRLYRRPCNGRVCQVVPRLCGLLPGLRSFSQPRLAVRGQPLRRLRRSVRRLRRGVCQAQQRPLQALRQGLRTVRQGMSRGRECGRGCIGGTLPLALPIRTGCGQRLRHDRNPGRDSTQSRPGPPEWIRYRRWT